MRFRLRPVLFRFATRHSARAHLVAPGKPKAESILDYPWSSVARGYALAPKARPKWLSADAGLEVFGFQDNARSRRRFVERLDGRMLNEDEAEANHCGVAEIEGQTLNSTLRRGWYWGGEEFKEAMLRKLDELSASRRKEGSELPTSHDYKESSQSRDHNLRMAEAIIREGVSFFDLQELQELQESLDEGEPLPRVPRGDLSAVAIAWAICKNTTIARHWIAERLSLGSAGNVSERVRRFERLKSSELEKILRKWKAMKL